MNGGGKEAPRLYALLVGADQYLPNQLPGGKSYPRLHGCVADVDAIEHYLRFGLEVPEERVERLAASYSAGLQPPEPREVWPTYENLTAALLRLEARAEADDLALVYYSGHGGRAPSLTSGHNGSKLIDECLVPIDIGEASSRYLRDVEVAAWLLRMRRKRVFVVLVLDCCHSAGATRACEAVRGLDVIDDTPRAAPSLLATEAEIAAVGAAETAALSRDGKPPAAWNGTRGRIFRNAFLTSTDDFHPRGFVLLAACTASQKAIEVAVGQGKRRGLYSCSLLEALGRVPPAATFDDLHRAVAARLQIGRYHQVPMIEGERERLLFGRKELPSRWGIDVLACGEEGEGAAPDVLLATGSAQGVHPGARFALFPMRGQTPDSPAERLAEVEVEQSSATTARARLLRRLHAETPLVAGCQAKLLQAGPGGRSWRVRLPPELGRSSGDSLGRSSELRAALAGVGVARLVPALPDGDADFVLSENCAGRWEILDGCGSPLAALDGPGGCGRPVPAADLARCLEHLALYRGLAELSNPEPPSVLRGGLRVSLVRLPEGYDPDQISPTAKLTPAEGPYEVTAGEWVQVEITNGSPDELYVVLLDFQPDWGISQVFPAPQAGDFCPIEPGQVLPAPLSMFLPGGMRRGADLLKVFATSSALSWRWLELPPLAERGIRGLRYPPEGTRQPRSPRPPAEAPAGEAVPESCHEWVTAGVELGVVAAAEMP